MSAKIPAIQENVPIAPLTTLKVGGPARFFVKAGDISEITETLEYCRANGLPLFVLGGGSNVLVSDAGFAGVVLQVAIKGIATISDSDENVVIEASAGEEWDDLVAYCVENDLAGVECMSGIPGMVGGTPVQNVGAYGQEVGDSIVDVTVIDRETTETVIFTNQECRFAYRASIFNTTERDRYVVISVKFRLRRGGRPLIEYRDLRERFVGIEPSLADVRQTVLSVRRSKSMVIDPDDPNCRSAGSFFKNPVITRDELLKIAATFPNVPSFDIDASTVKVPAAWLIENAGISKGYIFGNAGVSSNHSLAIINRNGATAAEIVALKEHIQDAVRTKFGIFLQPEPIAVGFADG